jgi:hypothetical protein
MIELWWFKCANCNQRVLGSNPSSFEDCSFAEFILLSSDRWDLHGLGGTRVTCVKQKIAGMFLNATCWHQIRLY